MLYCVGHRPIHNRNRKKGGGGGGGGGGRVGGNIQLRFMLLRFTHNFFSPIHYFYQSRRYENNVVKCCRSYCES